MSSSSDYGQTWSDPVAVVGRAASPLKNATFRNPYATYSNATGLVVLQVE